MKLIIQATLIILLFATNSCNDDNASCNIICKKCEVNQDCFCREDVNITNKCEQSGHGHFNHNICECECEDGWAGQNCDSPLIEKKMTATMKTSQTGKTRQFSTGNVKVTVHKGTGGKDTLIIHGSNSQIDYTELALNANLNSIVSPSTYPFNRSWGSNTVTPLVTDPDFPGVPYVSPTVTKSGEMTIEYFQLDPLILKATFNCTVEEFGNSAHTITVTEGIIGYK